MGSRKKTTEQFVTQAIEKHGDKYDYSETVYSTSKENVKIYCKVHKSFFYQLPNNHIGHGMGCPLCGNERRNAKLNRTSLDDFIKRAGEVHNSKYDYSSVKEFRNSKAKVDIICQFHGVFSQDVQGHLSGKGCPSCGYAAGASKQSLTREQFIAKCTAVHGDKYDYSKVVYTRAKNKVLIRCTVHDHWFEQEAHTHSIGGGCPLCHRDNMGQYHRLSVEDFIERSTDRHKGIYDYSLIDGFKNAHEKVPIQCAEHGIFYQTVSNHLYNHYGCPTCASIESGLQIRLTIEEVLERFINAHGDRFDYSRFTKYDGIYQPIEIRCKKHDNWFLQKPNDHFKGVGCTKCVDKGYSTHKSGYFYINLVGDNEALKVGITNICPIKRAKDLDKESSLYVRNLYYFFHEDGKFILNLERLVLNKFPTGIITKDIMRSGFTETVPVEFLPEVIDTVVYQFNNYKPA